jgi:hypothetical protein
MRPPPSGRMRACLGSAVRDLAAAAPNKSINKDRIVSFKAVEIMPSRLKAACFMIGSKVCTSI